MYHRITAYKGIKVEPIDSTRRIGFEPAAQPGGVVTGSVIVEPGAVVALFAGITVIF
jgi:hypothetical protein